MSAIQFLFNDQTLQPTYYRRDSYLPEKLQPELGHDLYWNVVPISKNHGIEVIFPMIATLYPSAGKALSLTLSGWELLSGMKKPMPSKVSFVKAVTELCATFTELKNGMIARTVMNLFDAVFECRHGGLDDFRLMPVIANGLYLITLLNVSKKIQRAAITASLLFQALEAAYRAYLISRKLECKTPSYQTFLTAEYGLLSLIYAAKAYRSFQVQPAIDPIAKLRQEWGTELV